MIRVALESEEIETRRVVVHNVRFTDSVELVIDKDEGTAPIRRYIKEGDKVELEVRD